MRRPWILLVLIVGGCDHPLHDPGVLGPDQSTGLPDDGALFDAAEDADAAAPAPPLETLLLGHRGVAWNVEGNPYPENTCLSVQAALAATADGVVVDLIRTADDVFVLRHDNALATRTPGGGLPRTNCRGHISAQTWSELETCLAQPFGEDGYRVPLDRLESILELPMTRLILDLKDDQNGLEAERSIELLGELLRENAPRTLLMLYESDSILWARELGLDACLKQHEAVTDAADFARYAAGLGAVAVCIHERAVSQPVVEALHEWDLEVVTYFLSSELSERFDARISELAAWGVSIIITDLVARAREVLDPAAP